MWFLATGNSKQLCGGPSSLTIWRNTLYVAPTLSLPAGWAPADPLCIMEVPGRALTGSFYAADDMTVNSCVAYCNGMGFPYAAVEYGGYSNANTPAFYRSDKLISTGRECMCGTSLVNGASFNKPSNACTMQCAGSTPSNRQVSLFFLTRALRRGQVADDLPFSAPKTCGGSNALNVYYSKNYVSKLVLPKGWESLGCIAEENQGRALISAQMDSDSMTIDMCLNYCSSKGFGMAGLEYGRQCFCAKDSLSNGASLAVTSNQWSVECRLARDGLKLTVNPVPFQLHAMLGFYLDTLWRELRRRSVSTDPKESGAIFPNLYLLCDN